MWYLTPVAEKRLHYKNDTTYRVTYVCPLLCMLLGNTATLMTSLNVFSLERKILPDDDVGTFFCRVGYRI